MVVIETLNRTDLYAVRLLHRKIHRPETNCKALKGNQIIVLTVE
jgi:hypothetical protein